MRFLLDTHTFLWFVADDPRLSLPARQLIEQPDSERFLSTASLWEMAIKVGIGKLTLPTPLDGFLREQLAVNQIEILPISLQHAAAVASLARHHGDPFDRMIVCQSVIEKLDIIGADAAMDAYGIARHW